MDLLQAEAFLRRQSELRDDARDTYHAFAVERLADNRLIGDVGMYLPSTERVGDLGFQFDPGSHGQGFAFEATTALIAYAFKNWGLDLVTSHCDVRNVPSYRLMERLGMKRVEDDGTSLGYELKRP